MDMRVDRKRRHPERLRHHHARRLMPHTRQLLQRLETPRHHTAVRFHEDLREPRNRLRLLRRQSTRPDHALNLRHRHPHHFLRRGAQGPQVRRHEIHPFVRALRRQQHRHEECVGVAVVERHRRFRVKLRQAPIDPRRALLLRCHDPQNSPASANETNP